MALKLGPCHHHHLISFAGTSVSHFSSRTSTITPPAPAPGQGPSRFVTIKAVVKKSPKRLKYSSPTFTKVQDPLLLLSSFLVYCVDLCVLYIKMINDICCYLPIYEFCIRMMICCTLRSIVLGMTRGNWTLLFSFCVRVLLGLYLQILCMWSRKAFPFTVLPILSFY